MSRISKLPVFLQCSQYLYYFVVPILFGTFNETTATPEEVELSQSLQTAFANFVKDPTSSPVPYWAPYKPEDSVNAYTHTLAKTAHQGGVGFGKEVELSQSPQTPFANFAKNPNSLPAPHLPPYEPEASGDSTLARIAYQGNVDFGNFVEPVQPDSIVSTRNNDAKIQVGLLMNSRP
jgi:hypothetical protein